MYSVTLSKNEITYLKEHKKIVFGTDIDAPPISFINSNTNQFEGMVIDYINLISLDLNHNIQSKPLIWKNVSENLKTGAIDVVDLSISKERRKDYLFTQPIYLLHGSIAVNKSETHIKSIEDLAGEKIAIPDGDYALEHFNNKESYKNLYASIVKVSDIKEGIELLIKGKVKAVVGDKAVISYHINNSYSDIKLLPTNLYIQEVSLAVYKDNRDLLSILNKGILNLKKKDLLLKTQEKWFESTAPIIKDKSQDQPLIYILLIGEIIVAGFYLWNSTLQRKVREKTTELELNKSDLQTIINTLNFFLFVVEEDYKIIDCNLMAEKLLHLNRNNIIGTSFKDHELLVHLQKNYASYNCYNGSYYSLTEQELIGQPTRKLISIEDLTEKIINEKRLRQESKMSAIGQLSAGLAHEIRNPLGIIKSYCYILKKHFAEESVAYGLSTISSSADRINNLIDNLLNFSRYSKDELTLINLKVFIENIVELMHQKISKSKVDIEVNCTVKEVLLNEESLKIILFNLLDNSLDSFKELSIDKNSITIEGCNQNSNLILIVKDNGCGITENEIEDLFNPFFSNKDTGVGLGLYIVKNELDHLNGNIKVESKKDVGSIFTVSIPIIAKERL